MKRNVPITSIMTTDPVTVHHGQKLSDVRRAMAEGQFHHVPVVSGAKLIGMLSSTDLLRVSYEYGTDPRHTDAVLDHTLELDALMTEKVTTLGHKQTVRDAAGILAGGAFHSLPVVDEEGDLKGIVTSTDIIRYLMAQY